MSHRGGGGAKAPQFGRDMRNKGYHTAAVQMLPQHFTAPPRDRSSATVMALLTLALVTLLALVDVRGEPPLTAQPPYSVDPDSQRMVDQHHRERYFHGLNVVVKGPPWLPDTSAFNATTSFAEKDCKVMQVRCCVHTAGSLTCPTCRTW